MKNIIIFGAGNTGRRVYGQYKTDCNIVCIVDNDERKYSSGMKIENVPVTVPNKEVFQSYEYDQVIIASAEGRESIKEQVLSYGVSAEKIEIWRDKRDAYECYFDNLREMFHEKRIKGDLAELGVYKGVTAAKMNRSFPNRKLHLFDTFEGFAEEDVEYEQDQGLSDASKGRYGDTSVDLVIKQMPYPDQIEVHKGFFPDTAKSLDGEFCLVRIDMDLAQPTEAALDFFHNRIVGGGVILVHDYFGGHYRGIKLVVDQYLEKHPTLIIMPTGDPYSVAIGGY